MGASDGIGKSIALRLAKGQTNLLFIARTESKLQEVAEAAKEQGASVRIYPCDISKSEVLAETIERLVADNVGGDVLINSADIWQKQMPVDEISPHVIDSVIDTNLTALIRMTHLLLPTLRTPPTAAIINVISKSGVLAQSGQSVYTASKYGARGFTEVLKEELKDSSVKVAGVYQGGTNTAMFKKTGKDSDTSQLIQPDDLANVVAFMLQQPDNIWLQDVRIGR